ncbi:MAG: hypothetical protein WC449_05655 [Candidatus Paceibacterota bacterium]
MNAETITFDEPEAIIGDEHEDQPEQDVEAEEQEVEQPEPEEEKVPRSVQKRINKAVAQKGAAERLAEVAREEAAQLRRELEQLKSGQPQPKAKQEGAPNPDDYDAGPYDPDYQAALIQYNVKQIFDNQQKQATIAQKESNVIMLQNKAREVHEDYDAVEAELFEHPITSVQAFRDILLESENPAEMAYYLGKNQDELDKISEMNATQALKYIGKLEDKISKSLEPAKKPVSNAPKPIAPLGSAKGPKTNKSPDEMTMDEYAAWYKSKK